MENVFEDSLTKAVKSLLPQAKNNLQDLELHCDHILVFLKRNGNFSFADSISFNGGRLIIGDLKISENVADNIFLNSEIKFIDDANYLFPETENKENYESLGSYFFITYPLYYQKDKLGLVVYLCSKERNIADKDKIILSLVSQNLSLSLEKKLVSGSLTGFVGRKVKLQKKFEDAVRQKDEFISMAAHELRAPMTAIKGYISMVIEGDVGDIPEKARRFLADANNINDRLIRLVNNMLNVSKIEEGRMVYQIEEENLSHFVRAVFSQFAPEAERKSLEYNLDIPLNLKDKVRIDPDRIQEVIGNIISNAVKYTDSGSVKVRLIQRGKDSVRCEVIDTGPGISEEEQIKLFQKFHRIESNVGKTTGTGLGLYICKLLVEKFSGKIGVVSEPGKGSTFWFELPLVR